ncbi:hypothetical protein [Nostoc sp.]
MRVNKTNLRDSAIHPVVNIAVKEVDYCCDRTNLQGSAQGRNEASSNLL